MEDPTDQTKPQPQPQSTPNNPIDDSTQTPTIQQPTPLPQKIQPPNRPRNQIFQRQIFKMIQLKQQLIAIRQRKASIPSVPDPQILQYFSRLKIGKQGTAKKQRCASRIAQKRRQIVKLKELYSKGVQQYQQKSQMLREKSALQRVLAGKMEGELVKTKERFREVQFNRVIVEGIRKVLYYRLAQLLFNSSTRNIFSVIANRNSIDQKFDEDSIGTCLGYLGLFMSIVSVISGAKTWINFTFRGSKSTIRPSESGLMLLHPKQPKLSESLKLLNQQLYQIMRDSMGMKIQNVNNFYQLCEQLSKEILSLH